MSITKRIDKNGNTYYDVLVEMGLTWDGKRDRRTKRCKTEKEANAAEFALKVEKDGLKGYSNRITFRKFVEDYYLPVKRAALRPVTMKGYESAIRCYLMPRFANSLVPDINRLQVQTMISSCTSYKTAKNAREVLRQILSEALQLELVSTNAAAGRFKFPEKIEGEESKSEGWSTSFVEHKKIIEQVEGDVLPILVLGLCFGLRKGEILGLDWKNVDFEKREIHITQTYVRANGSAYMAPPKKTKSKRTIPMTDYAYKKLLEIRGANPRIGAVALKNGMRLSPDCAYKLLVAFVKSHDVPKLTILSLRHSFATAAIRQGMNVASISKWLGHSDVITTLNRYVKPLMKDLMEDAKIIDAAYRAS